VRFDVGFRWSFVMFLISLTGSVVAVYCVIFPD
jgi:hypothetical protein